MRPFAPLAMLPFSRVVRVSVLCGSLLACKQASAQSRTLYNSTEIPRDFVVALLMTELRASDVPNIVIGEIPPLLASRVVVPEGARILGTIMRFGSSSVLFESTLPPDSLRAVIEAGLPARGWMARPQAQQSGGGFYPARSRIPAIYCSGAEVLEIQLVSGAGRGTLARLGVRDDQNWCAPTRQGPPRAQSHMPTLHQPVGSDSYSSCQQGPRNSYSSATQASLMTNMSAMDLMNHYDRQLADSGWKSGENTLEEKLVRFWERSTAPPAVDRTTITIVTQAARPECKSLTLEISGRTP